MANPKTARKVNVYGEDITEESRGSMPVVEYENEEQEEEPEQEPEEEGIPEAFIPDFQVAPDDIPPSSQVPPVVPSEEEQRSTLEQLYARLGVKRAREFLEQPPQPLTPEKETFAKDSSDLIAGGVHVLATWVFVIILGIEYQELAPTDEQAVKIVRPLMNVWVRHAPIASTISPDWVDLKNAATAMSDYTASMMDTFRRIQREKQQYGSYTPRTGQQQPTTENTSQGEVRASSRNGRPDATRGYDRAPDNQEPLEGNGYAGTIALDNLTDYERYNYDALRQLSIRDYEHRARKSGRV